MQPHKVVVRSPARLHFGLFSFGKVGRQFGGVGVMVERPSVYVEIRGADRFRVAGEYADYVEHTARCWAEAVGKSLPPCRVSVCSAPQRHVGLGSGTQLALSVAAGLHAWHQLPRPDAEELARLTGRGRRSAVGTHGFLHGGLIVELGKLPGEALAPLQERHVFPQDWRFVLVTAGDSTGLHGVSEHKAFDNLTPVSAQKRIELQREVQRNLIPALMRQDCEAFGNSLYRFGYEAGACFAAVQGGPYNGRQVTAMVDEIRSVGISGIGQSSWGPTLFCLVPGQGSAVSLAETLRRRYGEDVDVCVTAADNRGAQVMVE